MVVEDRPAPVKIGGKLGQHAAGLGRLAADLGPEVVHLQGELGLAILTLLGKLLGRLSGMGLDLSLEVADQLPAVLVRLVEILAHASEGLGHGCHRVSPFRNGGQRGG
jgi:hypothetical protein